MTHDEIRTEIASIERELDSLTFDMDNSYNDDGGAMQIKQILYYQIKE